MNKTLTALSIACALSAVATPALAGKGKAQPFAASITAMQDVNGNTDLTITTSVEQDGLSAPEMSKHIQLKSFDTEGELRWTQNYHDVNLTVNADNTSSVTYTFTDMERQQPVKLVELVQTPEITKTKVLRGLTDVKLRPDFTVDSIGAPAQVTVGELVNITAVIKELNGDLGADSNVTLSLDGTVIDTATGVELDPAADAAVTMVASFDTAGTYTLTVESTDVNPGDYDYSNNSKSFTIEVVEARENVQTYMYYWFEDRVEHYTYSNWYGQWQYDYEGKHESFHNYHHVPARLNFPFSIQMDLTVDGVTTENYVNLENIEPTYSHISGCYNNEHASIQVGNQKWVYVNTYEYCGSYAYTYVQVHQHAQDYVYHSQRWSSYYGNYSYYQDIERGEFLNAENNISSYFVFTDGDGNTYGGTFGIDLNRTSLDYDYTGYYQGYRRGYYLQGYQHGVTQ